MLGPNSALIFRLIHRDNLRWLLRNGMYCYSDPAADPSYRPIGNPDLTRKRENRKVPVGNGGNLCDYIAFYFTPSSLMLYCIVTGHGVDRLPKDELLILVSSLNNLRTSSVDFLFTDKHAYSRLAEFFDDVDSLNRIDWDLLRRRDFKKDPNDPGKGERYQAEVLAWNHVPCSALMGICCHTNAVVDEIRPLVAATHRHLTVVARPEWFFDG